MAAGKVFINYRREDTRADARNIRDRLVGAFGASRVFMDVDSLEPGQRFDQELVKALAQCDVFLAVIGPRWQTLLEERAQTPVRDYVREEIAAALAQRIPVIPVLIERTPMPAAESMPLDIRALVMHQKHELVHERFGRDVDDLIATMRDILRTRGYADEPLPADLPISMEVVREIEANPLFANPPPILAATYHLTSASRFEEGHQANRWALRTISKTAKRLLDRSLFGTGDSQRKVNVRALRPGLMRGDEVTTTGGRRPMTITSASLYAANGLIDVSSRLSVQTGLTIATRLLSFGATEGRIFPVETGNRFSFAATYHGRSYDKTLGNHSRETTLTRSFNIAKKYHASSFHPELTGTAYLVECHVDAETSGVGNMAPSHRRQKSAMLFFESLGLWIGVVSQDLLDKDKYHEYILRSFTLAR